jgi:hypothetical protein
MREFLKISGLVCLLAAGTAVVAKAADPTDQQRWQLYWACEAKENESNNELGLDFLLHALSGQFPRAILDWGQMVVNKTPNFHCSDFLTPELQRQAAAIQDCLSKYRMSGRQGEYGNPFPCGDTSVKSKPAPPPPGHGGFRPPN